MDWERELLGGAGERGYSNQNAIDMHKIFK